MSKEWFYVHYGQRHGPVSTDQLRRLVASGNLQPSDLIWKPNMSDWLAVASVPEIATDAARSESSSKQRLSEHPVVIGFLLLFCFPIGLYFVWNHPKWSPNKKLIWTGCWGAFLLLGYVTKSDKHDPKNSPAQDSGADGKFVLTADYFPFKPGSQTIHLVDMYLPDGQTMRTRHIESQKAGGNIENVTDRIGTVVDGKPEWLKDVHLSKQFPDQYRLSGQFVEIGTHLGETSEIYWEPKLKLGAGLGDSWNWQPLPGTSSNYRVVEITGSIARIEEELVVDGGRTVTTTTYRKGAGVIAFEGSATFGHDDGRLHPTTKMMLENDSGLERSSTDPPGWKDYK